MLSVIEYNWVTRTAHDATELTMASKPRGASRRKQSANSQQNDHMKDVLEELPPVDGYGPLCNGLQFF